MLQKWKSAVDKGKSFGVLLTDLSQAFNCLSHELLLAKLHAYGFSIVALRLIHGYLTNTQQRTKINMSFSSWEKIVFGVPQGSMLGPLLFIVKKSDLSSHADDNTSFRITATIEEVIELLERDSTMLFKCFSDNQMKASISKCHFLVNKKDKVIINLGKTEIKDSEYEKLLGIKVDTKLNFNKHLNDIINKASREVNALSRIVPCRSLCKKKILMNSFFNSQFSCCPLIWMFHSCIMNNKINRLHERCMRLIHEDKKSSFEELLQQDKSVSIHTRNLQIMATEMFKVYRSMSPPIFGELFRRRDICYDLKSNSNFAIPSVKSVFHGSKSISYLVPKIWDIVPLELKQLTSLNAFKKGIKNWQPKDFPCRLCKQYVLNLGFISNTSETCF